MFVTPCSPPNACYLGLQGCGHRWEEPLRLGGFPTTRKAQYVAGGHKTEDPTTPTYASIVSRDSVCIGFLLAALNDLDVLGADVADAYLNAPCHEKVFTICGLEFGPENVGKVAINTKALYGLKTSTYSW